MTTHVHHIVEDDKCSALRFGFVSQTDLTNAAISPEQLVEVVTSDLIVEIFDEQNPVCTWWKLCLRLFRSEKGSDKTWRLTVGLERDIERKTPALSGTEWRETMFALLPIVVSRLQPQSKFKLTFGSRSR